MTDQPTDTIADDLLDGLQAIAEFIGESQRRTQYLCERQLIPCGRLGSRRIASKSVLRAHYAKITAGEGRAA